MKAVILAAGKGTRLQPLTHHTPKALISIGGQTIVDRIFMSLPNEITEVLLVVDHLKDKIFAHVGNSFHGMPVIHIEQINMSGTLGALFSARPFLNDDETFLVLNGDDIYDKTELAECLQYPRSMGLQRLKLPGYHSVHLDANGYITGFFPQTRAEETTGALIATGAYVVDSHIFDHPGTPNNKKEFGLPETMMTQKDVYPIKGVIMKGWLPINTTNHIFEAEAFLAHKS